MWLKLEAVRVVEKLDAVLRERFAGLIEILNRAAAIFFCEGAAMRDPRSSGVFQAERFCVSYDAVNIIAKSFIRIMVRSSPSARVTRARS